MRFSKRTYPLLDKFEFNLADDIDMPSMPDEKKAIQRALSYFNEIGVQECFGKVSYISNTFFNDAIDNQEKILPTNGELRTDPLKGQKYCFLHNKHVYMGSIGEYYLWFYGKTLNGAVFDIEGMEAIRIAKRRSHGMEQAISYISTIPIVIYQFRELAEIKAKTLPPNKKATEHHCIYKSDLNIPIELLTENWYTESIQGHPFVVRWHWRVQRHGPALSKKKLVKIASYMKQGYTKGAYKEKQ